MELSPEEKKRIYEEEKARVEAQEKAKKEAEAKETVSQVRPWVRFSARFFDYMLLGGIAGLIVGIIAPSSGEDVFVGPANLLGAFIWVFVEASLLSTWGTTPGKWLLGTTLQDSAGNKLTFSSALNRSFSVWWRGIGCGIPIISLITIAVAHKKLTKEGITTWDRKGKFVVSHKEIGALRTIVAIGLFICYGFLLIVGKGLID